MQDNTELVGVLVLYKLKNATHGVFDLHSRILRLNRYRLQRKEK